MPETYDTGQEASSSDVVDPNEVERELNEAFEAVIRNLTPQTPQSRSRETDVGYATPTPPRNRFGDLSAVISQQPLAQEVTSAARAVGSAISSVAGPLGESINSTVQLAISGPDAKDLDERLAKTDTILKLENMIDNMWYWENSTNISTSSRFGERR